jgi:hypothetical protein
MGERRLERTHRKEDLLETAGGYLDRSGNRNSWCRTCVLPLVCLKRPMTGCRNQNFSQFVKNSNVYGNRGMPRIVGGSWSVRADAQTAYFIRILISRSHTWILLGVETWPQESGVKWSVWKRCVNLSARFRTTLKEKLYCSVGLTYRWKRRFFDKVYFSAARKQL